MEEDIEIIGKQNTVQDMEESLITEHASSVIEPEDQVNKKKMEIFLIQYQTKGTCRNLSTENEAGVLDRAPPGTTAECNARGWMTTETFMSWFQQFVKFSGASITNPVLLLLDGHVTHMQNIEVIENAHKMAHSHERKRPLMKQNRKICYMKLRKMMPHWVIQQVEQKIIVKMKRIMKTRIVKPMSVEKKKNDHNLLFQLVNEGTIIDIIDDIGSKAFGNDGLNIIIIRLCCPLIIPIIVHIMNECLLKRYFPRDWKFAKVIPLSKAFNCCGYWPVGLQFEIYANFSYEAKGLLCRISVVG
ncbi:hypothetical protein JTB14_033026 [Gonioctena quinquepunctata]|nr:hypothetical protein JTB14_033026 [Gonioctena quinquepunctata]